MKNSKLTFHLGMLILLWTDQTALAQAFKTYLDVAFPPADGFDFPVGDRNANGSYKDSKTGKTHTGWYKATEYGEKNSLGIHPGEDWNGRGGGNTDYGQPVFSTANGKVVVAQNFGKLWGNVVAIEHVYYENYHRKRILSLYAHLASIDVKDSQVVSRRQRIGTIGRDPDKLYLAHLHFEMRTDLSLDPTYWPSTHNKSRKWIDQRYVSPSQFISERRSLFVPQNESTLVLVDHETYKMNVYKNGKLSKTYDVSFGQAKGKKRVQGDNKTPKGMYFIVSKYQGKIGGPYGDYYGDHWIKINYPNKYDAARGVKDRIISQAKANAIARDWSARKLGDDKTGIGGGIGFHGWNQEWSNDGPRHLSWGCIVLHLRDINDFYRRIDKGVMVVIM